MKEAEQRPETRPSCPRNHRAASSAERSTKLGWGASHLWLPHWPSRGVRNVQQKHSVGPPPHIPGALTAHGRFTRACAHKISQGHVGSYLPHGVTQGSCDPPPRHNQEVTRAFSVPRTHMVGVSTHPFKHVLSVTSVPALGPHGAHTLLVLLWAVPAQLQDWERPNMMSHPG